MSKDGKTKNKKSSVFDIFDAVYLENISTFQNNSKTRLKKLFVCRHSTDPTQNILLDI